MSVVMVALQLSLGLLVLSIGLHTRPGDALFLFRHPALFARSVLAINVIMPVFVVWVAFVFALKAPVMLALLALSMSPMPPFLPVSAAKAGGEISYTVALLAAESALAIVLVPLATWILGLLLQTEIHMSAGVVAKIVVAGILLPLALGAGLRQYAPHTADRIARPVNAAAIALLAAGFIPLLVVVFLPMVSLIGNGTIVAIIAIAIIGLGVGHALGGPDPKHRPVLALATASRHPAVAIAIASAAFPEAKLAPAAIVLAMLTTALVSFAYTKWEKKLIAAPSTLPLITTRTERRSAPRTAASSRPRPSTMHARPPGDSHH
jgi:bile acid:Na+ symporter, BASS family